ARPSVKVTGPFGIGAVASGKLPDSGQLLPGASLKLTARVPDVTPAVRSTADVSVIPLLTDAAGSIAPLPAISGSGHAWTLPWTLLLALVVVLGLAVAVVRRVRRVPVRA